MLELITAALVAFFSGVIGTTGGGGGLPSLAYLLFVGFPVVTAIATMRMAAIGIISGSIMNFHKGNKIDWKLFRTLAPLSLLGGIIGGSLLTRANNDSIEFIVGLVLLAILPTFYIKKNFGLKATSKSSLSKSIGLIVFFFCSIFAGFIGPGSAFLFILVLVQFFGLTLSRALATELMAFGIVVVSSFIIFVFKGLVDYKYGLVIMIFGALGGFVGSKLAVEKGDKFVKVIMTLVILATSAKLLLF